MGAKKKPVDKITIGDIGLEASQVGEAGSKAKWFESHDPPAKAAGEIIEDEDTNETVERIVAWLDERKLI
jgi:electron transfer flavoprotein beta subunit